VNSVRIIIIIIIMGEIIETYGTSTSQVEREIDPSVFYVVI